MEGGFSEGRTALGVDGAGDWARRVAEMGGRRVVHDLER